MTGSLQSKKGFFYVVLNTKNTEGKRKQEWIATHIPVSGGKRQAQQRLVEVLATYTPATSPTTSSILFVDCIRNWLQNKAGQIEQSTYEGYVIYAERHIIPYFEELDLAVEDVKPKHIQDYYRYKLQGGRCDGKLGGLSTAAIQKHGIVIRQVLAEALMLEYIVRNPASNVPIPKGLKNDTVERTFLNAQQGNQILQLFNGNRLQIFVFVTLYYGLRRSEALGLKWSAIDFANKSIRIQHTVVKNSTVIAKDRAKSQASKRTYPLIPEVESALLSIKQEQELNKILYAGGYLNSDYVFTWDNGEVYRPDYVTRAFQRVLRNNNLPVMRLHDLRHSTASILYDKGWSMKDIQGWLGHADIETTADIYTHISKDRQAMLARDICNTLTL